MQKGELKITFTVKDDGVELIRLERDYHTVELTIPEFRRLLEMIGRVATRPTDVWVTSTTEKVG